MSAMLRIFFRMSISFREASLPWRGFSERIRPLHPEPGRDAFHRVPILANRFGTRWNASLPASGGGLWKGRIAESRFGEAGSWGGEKRPGEHPGRPNSA